MESPLHHFEVHTIIPIHIAGLDLSINNAVVAMWVGLAIVAGSFMLVVSRGISPIPGKLQSILEISLEFIRNMVYEFIGEDEGKKYVPFIASLFLFILACNLIGLVPGSYTITSQLAVTGVCRWNFYSDFDNWIW
jgi:F-type H+-transporting ATPase subunit a